MQRLTKALLGRAALPALTQSLQAYCTFLLQSASRAASTAFFHGLATCTALSSCNWTSQEKEYPGHVLLQARMMSHGLAAASSSSSKKAAGGTGSVFEQQEAGAFSNCAACCHSLRFEHGRALHSHSDAAPAPLAGSAVPPSSVR